MQKHTFSGILSGFGGIGNGIYMETCSPQIPGIPLRPWVADSDSSYPLVAAGGWCEMSNMVSASVLEIRCPYHKTHWCKWHELVTCWQSCTEEKVQIGRETDLFLWALVLGPPGQWWHILVDYPTLLLPLLYLFFGYMEDLSLRESLWAPFRASFTRSI